MPSRALEVEGEQFLYHSIELILFLSVMFCAAHFKCPFKHQSLQSLGEQLELTIY